MGIVRLQQKDKPHKVNRLRGGQAKDIEVGVGGKKRNYRSGLYEYFVGNCDGIKCTVSGE